MTSHTNTGTRNAAAQAELEELEERLNVHDALYATLLDKVRADNYPSSALNLMLHRGRDEGRALESALDGLAKVFGDPETAWNVGPQFSCAEADTIADVLVASRHDDAAIVWLQAHAARDTTDARHGGRGFDAKRYLAGR